MNPTILNEIKRCLRLYGACSLDTLATYLLERGIVADSTLPVLLREAVEQKQLRELVGSRQRQLYALPLEESQ